MQIKEFSQPITSKKLNESLASKFGYKVQLENFTDVQLEDARNKLRTRISQFEVNESYDSMLENHEYQKTRMFLDVINQEIMEREEKKADKDYDGDGEVESGKDEYMGSRMKAAEKAKAKKVDENYVTSTFRKRALEMSVPEEWIDSALERIELGESDTDELKAELLTRYDLNETQAAWTLLEGEEQRAEIIMATKDMVDRITGWLEDVAAMKAEQLLELMDSIREEQGSDVAAQYEQAVKPALESIYAALESSRQGLSQGLGVVSGEETETMGQTGATMPAPAGGAEAGPAPEMGGEGELGAELATPAEEAGRAKRESVEYSRKLGMLLNSKKK
jgi:hypothetical protein